MDKVIRKNSNTSTGSTGSGKQGYGGYQNNMGISLGIRTELFDHGVFPLQSHHGKITSSILIETFTNLNLLSSIDYKIKLQTWIDQAVKYIPGMSQNDAMVYFFTYKNLMQEIDGQNMSASSSQTGFGMQAMTNLDPNIPLQ